MYNTFPQIAGNWEFMQVDWLHICVAFGTEKTIDNKKIALAKATTLPIQHANKYI